MVKRPRSVILRPATGAEIEEVMREMGKIPYSLDLSFERVKGSTLGPGELSVVKHAHYNSIARTHSVYGKKGGSSDKDNAQWSPPFKNIILWFQYVFRGIYQGDANNIKTAIFGACYDTDGSLTREAQNGYLLPRVVAIAAPPAIAVPELVVLTEEERQSKYSEIYQLAEELCRSTVVLPEKEKEIQEMTEERLREKLVQDFDYIQEYRRKAFYLPLDQRRTLLKYLDLVTDALLQYAEIEDE